MHIIPDPDERVQGWSSFYYVNKNRGTIIALFGTALLFADTYTLCGDVSCLPSIFGQVWIARYELL